MSDYKKYYKTTLYAIIRKIDLHPMIRRRLKKKPKMSLVECKLDLKTNKISIKEINTKNFCESMFGKGISKRRQFFNKIMRLLFSRRANIKTINTEAIKHLFIRAITKSDSDTYKASGYKWELLRGIVDSTGVKQPVYISDNLCYSGEVQHLFSSIGMHETAKEIWDVWMESKTFTDADRKALRKRKWEEMYKITTFTWPK